MLLIRKHLSPKKSEAPHSMSYFNAPKRRPHIGWLRAVTTTLVASFILAPNVAALAATQPAAPLGATSSLTTSIMFGAYAKVRPDDPVVTGVPAQDAVLRLESEIGRTLTLDHMYYNFNNKFPNPRRNAWDKAGGRIPFINWAANNGQPIQWSAIASGAYDNYIDLNAYKAVAYGSPIFVAFNHEPDNEGTTYGTSADYVAAYRHIANRYALAGATNVKFVLILMAQTYNALDANRWNPGDAVDYVAADGYNYGGPLAIHSQNYRSFHDIFNTFYNFSLKVGKPAIVSEYATTEDTNNAMAKADWITAASDQLKQWPNIQGAMYFSSNSRFPWWVDSSTTSTASYAAVGADPYFSSTAP
jgi:hypothetical protein